MQAVLAENPKAVESWSTCSPKRATYNAYNRPIEPAENERRMETQLFDRFSTLARPLQNENRQLQHEIQTHSCIAATPAARSKVEEVVIACNSLHRRSR